jgi:hypothetical protein
VPIPQPHPQQQHVWITVYSCSRCGTELGRGPTPPNIAVCPNCGCGFGNAPWRQVQVAQPAEGLAAMPSALKSTLGIEGAFFGGLVLVGVIRLVIDRSRRPASPFPEAEAPAPA